MCRYNPVREACGTGAQVTGTFSLVWSTCKKAEVMPGSWKEKEVRENLVRPVHLPLLFLWNLEAEVIYRVLLLRMRPMDKQLLE